jgi:hypothetical protein
MITWDKTLAEKWLGPLPGAKPEPGGAGAKQSADMTARFRVDFLARLNAAIEANRNSAEMVKTSGMLRVDKIEGKWVGFEGAKYRGKFLRKEFRDYYDSLSEEDKKSQKKRLKHRIVLEDKASIQNYLEGLKSQFEAGALESEFCAIDQIRAEMAKD